jgi:hypothetical protein
MLNHQLTLTELLDDPMTRAVMAADRVDPAALKATLSAVAQKLQHDFATHQQMNCAGWNDQRWLLNSLTGQKRSSDNDGRMAQSTGSAGWQRALTLTRCSLSFITSSSEGLCEDSSYPW